MADLDEFAFIAARLRPLARGHPAALDLKDDAAVFDLGDGRALVLTVDTLIAGRHFLAEDDPGFAARKALRANLSDLAAMAAAPVGYLLSVVWPESFSSSDRDRVVEGLAEDAASFDIPLLGGDTTSGPGPLTVSITAIGSAPLDCVRYRRGARAGDRLVVTGPIGDGGLGLEAARGRLEVDAAHAQALAERYRLPVPRLDLIHALRADVEACLDISDGLLADAGHLAAASELAIEIDLEAVPLSEGAQAWLARQDDGIAARAHAATAGDDYELACAVSPDRIEAFLSACAALSDRPAAVVGSFRSGAGVKVMVKGRALDVPRKGFTHF